MRAGNRRSAIVIMSRALPGISCSSFVLMKITQRGHSVQASDAKRMGQLLGRISVDRPVSITADARSVGLLAIWRAVCDTRQPAPEARVYL
jgi:hypothetical protein